MTHERDHVQVSLYLPTAVLAEIDRMRERKGTGGRIPSRSAQASELLEDAIAERQTEAK